MTITSNNPAQINAALADLARRSGNSGRSKQRLDTSGSAENNSVIRFYMSDFTDAVTSHSYILLGNTIIVFGRNVMTKGLYTMVPVWKNNSNTQYYQPQQTVEIPVPYKLKSNPMYWGTVVYYSASGGGSTWRAFNAYEVVGSSKRLVSMPNGNHITFAGDRLYWYDVNGASYTYTIDYCIVGEIDV